MNEHWLEEMREEYAVSEARHRHPYLVFAIYCTAAVAVSIAAGVALELWLCP